MSHTPGPWRVDETVATGAYGVWTEYATHPGHDGEGYPSQICSVFDSNVPREQKDANARLIAAAPGLLAACKAALDNLEEIHGRERQWACEKLEVAIAKAEKPTT